MDYSDQEIDQMIDEIFEEQQPETVTKVCRKCGASFEAKRGSTRTLCPACFREARAANAKLGREKLAREAAKKPGGGRTGPPGREPLTVGKLLELLGSVPRDAVIRDVTAVELRSIWEPSQGQRAELFFRKEEER